MDFTAVDSHVPFFVYFVPRAIAYPDYYVVRGIIPIIILLIIPLLVSATVWTITYKWNLSVGIAAAIVLIVGPTFGLFQGYREKMELKQYGIWTNAIVVNRKEISEHGGGTFHWGIKCRYVVNNRDYETLYHDDLQNIHPIGDTIKIIYSSKFPKIYSLSYEWKE